MADLVAADITVSVQPRHKRLVHGLRTVIATVSGGDGIKLYPTNGIPLPALGKFGLHSEVAFAGIQQPLDGLEYRYDENHHTLRIFQSAALATHTHDLKFIGGITATEPVAIDGGDTLGKNAATDRTIAGANSATKGGVVAAGAVVAAPLVELGHVAVPAFSLKMKIEGQ